MLRFVKICFIKTSLSTCINFVFQRPVASLSRKRLFETVPEKRFIKGQYTLKQISSRLTGLLPAQSHYAESDVITLMNCGLACKSEFVRVVSTNSRKLLDVKRF